MKIAIVHDYIKEYGGAERVLEEFVKIFPNADIYTSVYLPEFLGPHKERFKNFKIHTSGLQHFPFKAKLISLFRLFAPFAFMGMDLSNYDIILVSQTGAYFPNVVKKGHSKLICYTHTPPRYLYGYATARDWKNNKFKLVLGSVMNHFLRIVDYNSSKNVDQFIANSQEVASRIKKFYRRESVVINPPVVIPSELVTKKKSEYYVAGGRLARAKGIDIIIEAFILNKQHLKIFGKGFAGFEEELREKLKNKKHNIELLGEISDVDKLVLMRDAKAYIFASYDEDFGITPVEAMSVGTPVVAFKSGGVLETVVDGKTGLFYFPNTQEALNNTMSKLKENMFSPKDCFVQAQKFSEKNFERKIKEIISNA